VGLVVDSVEGWAREVSNISGPRPSAKHMRRAPTVAEALKACARCTIRVRRGVEIECPECDRWVKLTGAGTLPKHQPLMPESMLDADQNCFATGHRPKRVWGRTKVLTFGGQAVSQNYDQYGNLEFGDHPYSLDACQLAKTANAKPQAKTKASPEAKIK